MKIDFHTHSTNSDWDKTPSELLQIAKQKNAKWMVITDHNFFDNEIQNDFKNNGIWSCSWVEISSNCDFENLRVSEIHITHYSCFIKSEIEDILSEYRLSKKDKIKDQIELLSKLFESNYDDFINYWIKKWVQFENLNSYNIFLYIDSKVKNRDILEKILWKNYTAWDFIVNFLQKNWINNEAWLWFSEKKVVIPKIEEYQKLVWKKYISSVAHPNYSFYKGESLDQNLWEFEDFIKKATNFWINWVEINLKAPKVWVELTLEIAKKLDLVLTFWSDFHSYLSNWDNKILENNPFVKNKVIRESFHNIKEMID